MSFESRNEYMNRSRKLPFRLANQNERGEAGQPTSSLFVLHLIGSQKIKLHWLANHLKPIQDRNILSFDINTSF